MQGHGAVRKGFRALCTLQHSLCPGHQIPAGLQSYDKLLHAAKACSESCIRPVRLPTLCTQTWSILKDLCSHLARRPGGPGKPFLRKCGALFAARLSAFPMPKRLCHWLCFALVSLQSGSQVQPVLERAVNWCRSKRCSVPRASMWSRRCCAQQQLARCSSWMPWRRTMRCGEPPCSLCFGVAL